MKNLRILPKVRDSLTYLYVEHCRIDQDAKAIAIRCALCEPLAGPLDPQETHGGA